MTKETTETRWQLKLNANPVTTSCFTYVIIMLSACHNSMLNTFLISYLHTVT